VRFSNIEAPIVDGVKKFEGAFMKKLFMVGVLGLALGITGVFAQHPGGLGIGIQGGFAFAGSGGGLSLKLPSLPIYWVINLNFGGNNREYNTSWLTFGLSGDYYFYDQALVPEIGLGWYLGGGGYFWYSGHTYHFPNSGDNRTWALIGLGGELPIGLSWMIPIPVKLELYIQAVPHIGFKIALAESYNSNYDTGLDWGFDGNIGIRIWL
jgi:hypothetical protein